MRKSTSRYARWLILSFLVMLASATYICLTNGSDESDLRFWVETIINGLSISIFSSVLLMFFFDRHYNRERQKRQIIVLRRLIGIVKPMAKFLLEIEKNPTAARQKLYKARVERFCAGIRAIEENHLFELDAELLKMLEEISASRLSIEEYSLEEAAGLSGEVENIMKKIDEVTGKNNFHRLEEL